MFLILMDIVMFSSTMIALFGERTQVFWFILSILFSTFLMVYSVYALLRCYQIFPIFVRNIAIIGNVIMYICFLIFSLSDTGFIENNIGTFVFVAAIPFPFSILSFITYQIVTVIKSNPMYIKDIKQRQLMKIFEITMTGIYAIGIPCITMAALAGFLQNGTLLWIALTLPPFIKLILSLSNFGVLLNKSLGNVLVNHATGTSIFHNGDTND